MANRLEHPRGTTRFFYVASSSATGNRKVTIAVLHDWDGSWVASRDNIQRRSKSVIRAIVNCAMARENQVGAQ